MLLLPSQPIPRCPLGSLAYTDFLREYVGTTTPLILEGAGEHWKAAHEWSIEHLISRADEDEEVILETMGDAPTEYARARVPVVLEEIRSPSPDRRYSIYLSNWSFLRHNPDWAHDYAPPRLFSHDRAADLTGHFQQLKWLFIGEDGTGSALHSDVASTSAWLYVFRGHKHWRLLRTEPSVPASRRGPPRLTSLFSSIHEQTLGDEVTLFDGVQGPGDLIFVPAPILHEVKNVGVTVALTHNFVDCSDLVLVAEHLLTVGGFAGKHHLDRTVELVRRDYLDLSRDEQAAADGVMRGQLSTVRSTAVRPLLERAGFVL